MTVGAKMTDDQFNDELMKMFEEGREEVLTNDKRRRDFGLSMARAAQAACNQPGCEVKVTCRDVKELLFAHVILEEGLRRLGRLDDKNSKAGIIEVANGSCITLHIAATKGGGNEAGGDVDFESGADALAVVPDDGSGSVRGG